MNSTEHEVHSRGGSALSDVLGLVAEGEEDGHV